MKERPILFSAPMVKAILSGTKTQTRRIVKPQQFPLGTCVACPYGTVGDRLWVRETWLQVPAGIAFRADGGDHYGAGGKLKWRPSIFMPRAASRITLEVTGVRVERLQGISEDDAEAEGVAAEPHNGSCVDRRCFVKAYASLWDSLNAKRSPWSSNPWVWVLSFRRITP